MDKKRKLFEEYTTLVLRGRRISSQIHSSTSFEGRIATLLQIKALDYLEKHPGSTIGELSEILYMSSPSIVQFVKRLEKTGFIIKEVDQKDRRVTHLFLTKDGKQKFIELNNTLIKKSYEVFSYIPPKDMETVIRIVKNFLEKLENSNIKI